MNKDWVLLLLRLWDHVIYNVFCNIKCKHNVKLDDKIFETHTSAKLDDKIFETVSSISVASSKVVFLQWWSELLQLLLWSVPLSMSCKVAGSTEKLKRRDGLYHFLSIKRQDHFLPIKRQKNLIQAVEIVSNYPRLTYLLICIKTSATSGWDCWSWLRTFSPTSCAALTLAKGSTYMRWRMNKFVNR